MRVGYPFPPAGFTTPSSHPTPPHTFFVCSIHVVEVSESGSDATYKLTSTIMLSLTTTTPAAGDVTLAGSLTRQNESTGKTDSSQGSDPHIVNIGKMVEEMETKMRMQVCFF